MSYEIVFTFPHLQPAVMLNETKFDEVVYQ
jgi:hypothetical protein